MSWRSRRLRRSSWKSTSTRQRSAGRRATWRGRHCRRGGGARGELLHQPGELLHPSEAVRSGAGSERSGHRGGQDVLARLAQPRRRAGLARAVGRGGGQLPAVAQPQPALRGSGGDLREPEVREAAGCRTWSDQEAELAGGAARAAKRAEVAERVRRARAEQELPGAQGWHALWKQALAAINREESNDARTCSTSSGGTRWRTAARGRSTAIRRTSGEPPRA